VKVVKDLALLASLYTPLIFGGQMGEVTTTPSCESNYWLFRLRAIDVIPRVSSNHINIVGGEVNQISDQVVPEFDITYYFTCNFSAEAIFGTMRHSVTANDTVLGQVNLGRVALLPPTITLQYHPFVGTMIDPYVGLGINFTYFYDISNGPISESTNYGNSFGPALQAGVNIALNRHWSLNADVKKIFIQTNAYVDTALGQLNPTVRLDPIIVGLGVGYRF
jgi:outer membrane protein